MKNPIWNAIFSTLLLLLFHTCLPAQTVQVTVLQGAEVRCCTDSVVTIQITPNPNGTFTEIQLAWGDGSTLTIQPGDPLIYTHTYSNYQFCAQCQEYVCVANAFINGFCDQISLLATYSNIPQENVSKIITFKVKPQAAITANPGIPCVGETVTFGANVCPGNDNSLTLKWTMPDGSMSTDPNPTYTFTQAQPYSINLMVLETDAVCGNGSANYTINPLNEAVANLVADSNAMLVSNGNYTVCLDGGMAFVRLNASASLHEIPPYSWSFMNPPGGNAQWFPVPAPTPTTGIVRVKFTAPGIYTFKVGVNNGCDNPDEATITIEVIAAPVLSLTSQPDVCEPLSYTPSPFNANAIYTIDGVVQPTFPVVLPIRNTPYIIGGGLANACGNQIKGDTFFVRIPPNISILSPAGPLTLCVGGPAVDLQGSLPGTWSGGAALITIMGGDTLFTPSAAGTYNLILSNGAGPCRKADTLMIDVVNAVALTLADPPDGCIGLAYTPSPLLSGASYTINGVSVSNNSFPFMMDATTANYTVVAMAANECGPSTASVDIFIDKPVDVSVISPFDTTICSGTAAIPLIGSDTIGHWVGPHISNTPQGWIFTPDASGNFDLVFERGNGDCRRADTLHIKVEPGDGVSAGPDHYLCITDGTYSFPAGNPAGGTYSGFGIVNGVINLSLLTPDSAYEYIYTVSPLPDACNDDQFFITVTTPPSGDFQLNADTSCVGKVVNVIPVVTTGVTHAVDWGDGTQNNSLMHTYSSAGTYAIVLTTSTTNPLTNQVLCSATATEQIHILLPIDADSIRFTMQPDTGCAVLAVTFKNKSTAESAHYTWNFGNGQTYNGYDPPVISFVQGAEDTIYIVRLTVKNGCDSISFVDTVRVFPHPTAKMGISYLSPCSGGVLKASVLSTGNPIHNTFYTTTGLVQPGIVSAPTYFQFFTDSLPKTIGIWLVTSNQCGVDTAYQEVVVHPTDVVAVIGLPDTTKLCVGEPLPFINYATTGAPIEWVFSNGNTYSGDSIQIITGQPGAYTLTLKVFGCGFDSMVVPLYVHPLPDLAVVHDLQQCPDVPVAFNVTSNTAAAWLYYGDGDSTLQKVSSHLYPGPGQYNVIATTVSEFGCKKDWTGAVTVLTPPVAGILASDSVCVGEPVLFTGSSDKPNSTCSWQFGDGNFSDQCSTSHAYVTPGLFTARLIVFSGEGCRDTAELPIYVRSRPSADFTYTIKEKCSPALVGFTNSSQGATGLLWTLGDGTTETSAVFDHIYQTGGAWQVMLIATNEGICSDTAIKTVTTFQTPVFDYLLKPGCKVSDGTDLTINTEPENYVAVTGTTYSGTGNYHGGLLADDYYLLIKSPEGCQNDTVIVVLPVNELYLQLQQDSFVILMGDSIQLEAEINQTGVVFKWMPNTYLDFNDIFNPASKPLRDINYIVEGMDVRGCLKYDTAYVTVIIDRDSSLFIPNAFTPNDDGNNDIFYVRNAYNPSIAGITSFQVFDKFGEKVFDVHDLQDGKNAKTENPYFGWDGLFKGDKAESGAYFYQIALRYVDGLEEIFKGQVYLIR